MNDAELRAAADAAAAADDCGRPSAAKRGRNPKFPYVPIIDYGEQDTGSHVTKTRQILGKAFATRDEAVEYARVYIAASRRQLAAQLLEPRMRALREHYGMPREITRDIQTGELSA